jgi:uncharacterized protein
MRSDDLGTEKIRALLNLRPHPTYGFVAETFRSKHELPASALPRGFSGPRSEGSVLYFMVTPGAQIRLHRIRSDQMYHHYLGDPLEVLLLYADGTGEVVKLGMDLQAGMRPQLFIPGGTFHISRLPAGAQYALLGTSEWPAVEPADVEVGDFKTIAMLYPAFRGLLTQFRATQSIDRAAA